MTETHTILGGKVHVYRRENSSNWQCSTYLAGKNHRITTKQDSLSLAKEIAEDWYLQLRGKLRSGEIKNEKTFADAAAQFLKEYEVITQGQRSPVYIDGIKRRLKVHLIPYFGKMGLSEVTPGVVQEYRIHRLQGAKAKYGKPPARNTMHQEIVTLRQTLKTAVRHRWLQFMPDLSEPYGASGKISHRAWFSADEYKKLYEATRKRAQAPLKSRYKWESEQLHDFVLFMANTGMRPDEAKRLQFRDVTIVEDDALDDKILEIEVRGKRGVGYCKSMPGAVRPFERLRDRKRPPRGRDEANENGEPDSAHPELWKAPQPNDLVFPKTHRELLKTVLDEEGLRADRDGRPRTAYSLRHSYICFRLIEGADIYQIAKNCRTSVEMIEKFYAAHIKTSIDAAAVNVIRPKKKKAKKEGQKAERPRQRSPGEI